MELCPFRLGPGSILLLDKLVQYRKGEDHSKERGRVVPSYVQRNLFIADTLYSGHLAIAEIIL